MSASNKLGIKETMDDIIHITTNEQLHKKGKVFVEQKLIL